MSNLFTRADTVFFNYKLKIKMAKIIIDGCGNSQYLTRLYIEVNLDFKKEKLPPKTQNEMIQSIGKSLREICSEYFEDPDEDIFSTEEWEHAKQ